MVRLLGSYATPQSVQSTTPSPWSGAVVPTTQTAAEASTYYGAPLTPSTTFDQAPNAGEQAVPRYTALGGHFRGLATRTPGGSAFHGCEVESTPKAARVPKDAPPASASAPCPAARRAPET
jgi:hypothetical protein